jgi:hypothetical protein
MSDAPQAEDVRRVSWNPRVQVFGQETRKPARSTGPAALSAPPHLPKIFHARVATKLTLQAVGHDSRTRAFGPYVGFEDLRQ